MKSPSANRKPPSTNDSIHTNASSLSDATLISINFATPPPYTPTVSEADTDGRRPLELVDNEPPVDCHKWAESTATESVSSDTAADDTSSSNDEVPPYVISCGDSCAILPDEPAVWRVKNTNIKLSLIATNVLLEHSLLKTEDLEFIATITGAPGSDIPLPDTSSKSRYTESNPTDPVSGAASAAFETVTAILMGLATGPMEAIHQVQNSRSQATSPHPRPNPYDKVAIGTAKGVGRILGAALKAPVLVTTNVSMGFNNVPKLFGDDSVREVQKVEGAKDGVIQAGKGLGTGLYDGITGVVTQPYNGAKQGGVLGGVKGFGKGIVGAVCKPAAGAVGLPAYALLGLWREGEKLGGKGKESQPEAEFTDGVEGFLKMKILEKWDLLTGKEKRG